MLRLSSIEFIRKFKKGVTATVCATDYRSAGTVVVGDHKLILLTWILGNIDFLLGYPADADSVNEVNAVRFIVY